MSARRPILAVLCVVLGAFVLSATPALAREIHVFSKSFDGEGEHALSDPQGVAIDRHTGNVYVVDSAHDRVEVFSSSGAFIVSFGSPGSGNGQFEEPTQIAVDNSGSSSGDVYVLDNGNERVEVFNAKDEYLSQIMPADMPGPAHGGSPKESAPEGIAVDPTGDLWVMIKNIEFFRFPPGGVPPASFSVDYGDNLAHRVNASDERPGLAIDPNGNLYVLQDCENVFRYSPSGEYLGYAVHGECPASLAIDTANGALYLDNQTVVHEFLASDFGENEVPDEAIGSGLLVKGAGLAVEASTGNVYVADAGSDKVDIFDGVIVPDTTTEAASGVAKTTATLHGTVDPDGIEVKSCKFEYGVEPGVFSHSAPCSPVAPYTGMTPEAVEAEIGGLDPSTTYYYRVVASNSGGTDQGFEEQFTTLPSVDNLSTGPAEEVTPNTAKLTGSLSPDGTDAHYYFEYGTSTAYGSIRPALPGTDAGSASEAVSAKTSLVGLTASTIYHYRLVGVNSFGSTFGEDETLTTPPAVEALSTGPAEEVTEQTAKLTGSLSPDGTDAHYYFEYGTSTAYGSMSPTLPGADAGVGGPKCVSPGGPECGPVSAETKLEGLAGDTTYHYRLVGINAFGITYGEDVTLLTQGPPLIDGESFAGRGSLSAEVDPGGLETHYHFEYGPTSSYGASMPIPDGEVSPGFTPETVSISVPGLAASTIYHFRVVASNADSLTPVDGPDQEFTTPPPVQVEKESVSDVASTSATLEAQVNPLGTDTHTYFQYGTVDCATSPASCTDVPVLPGVDIGGGEGDTGVSLHVQGLLAGTVYHYRVIATNTFGIVEGLDNTFTTQTLSSTLVLPDGREWELVSPANKSGGEVFEGYSERGVVAQASEDGSAVTYVTTVPVGAGGGGSVIVNPVLSRRGPDGWSSQDLVTPHKEAGILEHPGESGLAFFYDEYQAFSPNLSHAYVWPEGSTALAGVPANLDETYIRDNDSGAFTPTKLSSFEWYAEQVALAQGPKKCDPNTSPAKGEGVDAVSQDGCYVYFNSKSILTPDAVGANPLYVSHDEDGTWMITFVSSLSGKALTWGRGEELSPNGRYLAFMSQESLTGYDNEDVTSQSIGERMDEEVFLYDAGTNHLVCASCDPTGARPAGVLDRGEIYTLVDEAEEWKGQWLAGSLPDWGSATEASGRGGFGSPIYQPRYVFNEGRVVFDSPDALVSQDVNGLEDVYEYEPQSTDCSKDGGCGSLISSGTSGQESALVDSSVTGEDVFFMTSSKLVSQDYDNNYDVYDAHVCSASVPCSTPPTVTPPACETGDSCKAAPTPQPTIFGAPPSATFTGIGNPAPPPVVAAKTATKKTVKCAKGKKLNHGQCVKSKKKKAKRSAKRAGNDRRSK